MKFSLKQYLQLTQARMVAPVAILIVMLCMGTVFPQVVAAGTPDVLDTVVEALYESVEKRSYPESADAAPRYEVWTVATAYSSDPWQTDDTPCIPAMGSFDLCKNYEEYGTENTIAANFLPLGTKVRFPDLYGDKVFVVRDRMNAKYNGTRRVDFWVGSVTPTDRQIIQEAKAKAVAFGVKRLKMEVYGK